MYNDTIKVAHIADTHLRNRQYGRTSRAADFVEGFCSAIRTAAENGIKYMIVAGDILDTRNPGSAVCIDQLGRIQSVAEDHGVHLLYIMGNHDRLPEGSPPWEEIHQCDSGRFFSRGGFVPIRGCDAAINYGNARVIIYGVDYCSDAEMREMLPTLPAADILVWHAALKDFAGFPVESALEVREFAEQGKWKVVAMGDIHEHRKIEMDGTVVAYPGSTEMCSASEDPDKRMFVYTFNATGLVSVESLHFPTREVQRFTIDTDGDLEAFADNVHKGALVYVKYNDAVTNAETRLAAYEDESTIIVATPYYVASDGTRVEVGDLDTHDPVQFLRSVLPSRVRDAQQAERIEGLCADLFDAGADPAHTIESYCERRLS